jgi:hypothetical protein
METNDVDKRGARGRGDRESSRDPRVVYKPSPTATPESEIRVLAEAYRFLLDCAEKQSSARRGDGEGADREGDRG